METFSTDAMTLLGPKGRKSVALVVNDEQLTRLGIRQTLEEFDLTVLEVDDGRTAVEHVIKLTPDIVLLDVNMHNQDGYTTCAALRNLPNMLHLPIVVITSLKDSLSIHRAYEVGATDVITEPLNHELMCRRILNSLCANKVMKSLVKSEARLAEAQRLTRLGNWEWNLETNILWWSDEISRILDSTPQAPQQTYEAFLPFIHPDDRDMVDCSVRLSLKEKVPFNLEHRIVRPDGTCHVVQHLGDLSLNATGHPIRMFGTMQDITERKQTEDRLKLLNEAIACLPIGITIADADGRIIYTNPAEAKMHGFEPGELMYREASRFGPLQLSKRMSLEELQDMGVWKRESVNIRKNGEKFPVQLSSIAVKDSNGAPMGIVTACEDISARKKAEAKIQQLAFYDPLTKLPNRVLFNDRITYILDQATRYNRQGALFFLDIDRFKVINDSLGHAMGDLLLQELANRLSDAVRHTDLITREGREATKETLARFGGDEFTVWLTEVENVQDVVKVAQRILETFTEPFVIGKHEVKVTSSIGITIFPNDGKDRETLVKNADSAMYHAKAKGGDNYQFYSKTMNSAALTMLTMENSLRKAIEKDELLLYYQPQVDLESGEIVGAEALLRWQRDGGSLLSPDQFIPLAEKSGLIVQIGEWVLRKVCMQSKEWQDYGLPELRLSVNLSSRQFWQKQLAQTVSCLLREFGLDSGCLGLEITENILMQEEDSTIDALKSLKNIGVRLLIDDFGTGYSSLNYLKRFPLDYLKIDRSFIKDLQESQEDAAIVSAIIAMAGSLNLKVIAEGIETYPQLDFLRDQCCTEIQGFLVSKPLPPEEFTEFLQRGWEMFHKPSKPVFDKTRTTLPPIVSKLF